MAEKVRQALKTDMEQQKAYFEYMRDNRPNDYESYKRSEDALNNIYLRTLEEIVNKYAPATPAEKTGGETPGQIKMPGDSVKKKDSQ